MKKIAVLIPVFILALFHFRARYYNEYAMAGLRGKVSLALGVLLMFMVMIIALYKTRQASFLQGCIQSTFLIYIFMVLTLTGYFILFREITGHGWWQRVIDRIHEQERINLQPFLIFTQFRVSSKQVLGNFVLLFPLGIYIPLLFPGLSGFFRVFLVCLLISVCIELMQLITSYRSTDVDDVILNTVGGVSGYAIYELIRVVIRLETDD